jgi:zinc protease
MTNWARKIRLVFTLALVLVLTPLRMATAFDLKIEEFTLENGMRFILIPNPDSSALMHSLWYRVGSADEAPGKTGLAHYLEHLMYRGTKDYGPGSYFGQVDREGAEINAFTTRDYTTYHVRGHKDLLPLVMALEADRMQNLVFDQGLMETERRVVKEERRERLDTAPVALIDEAMDAALYANHPYSQPVVGYMKDVEQLTAEDAEAFYKRAYHPNNAVSIVSGDLTLDELRELAEKHFAQIPKTENLYTPPRAKLPLASTKQLIEMTNPATRTDVFLRSYIVPSFTSATGREALALDFLSAILANGTQGRFVKALVLDQSKATDIAVSYNGHLRHAGEFTITAIPAAGVSLKELGAAIDAVVKEIIKSGVTEAEIARALKRAKAARAYSFDRQATLVELVGLGAMTGFDGRDILELKGWETVTPDDIQSAARKYLTLEGSVSGLLYREKK